LNRFSGAYQLEIHRMKFSHIPALAAATVAVLAVCANAATAQNFSGPYLGASVGAGTAKTIWSSADFNQFESRGRGAIGGLQAGYNWQMGSAVLGVEGDYMFGNLKGTANCPNGTPCTSNTDRLGSLRARAGWVVAPPVMLYFTGGLAWGNTNWTNATAASTYNFSHSSRGYVLGGGAEFFLNDKWTLKAEYLRYNLGTAHASATEFGGLNADFKPRADTFKLGINFKF
jgi:outer membrane immunogenic protein